MQGADHREPSRASRLLEQAWAKGWATRPPLDAGAIVAAAERRERGEAASGPWRERLERLCASLREEAALNPVGRTSAYVQLVKLVRARIRAQRLMEAHPDIATRPLAPPVVVVGQMRSGTTRIHRLLACEPRLAANRLFEQLDPAPYRGPIDRRVPAAYATAGAMRAMNPSLHAAHPSAPMAAEEDFGLHAFSIWGALFEGQWRVPGFARWCEGQGAADVYDEFANLLRIAGWHRGLDPARPWLLKAPQFAQDLDMLLERFPESRLVVLRRPEEQLVASGASLVWNHSKLQSDAVTREEIGAEWLRKTRLRAERMERALERHPHVPRVELAYADVSRDWRGAVHTIYAMLGWTLGAATERRMARFLERSKAHEGHRYSLEDFGLDRAAVAAAFA